ncbi:hypothetical protein BC936DRAFT_138855 [Jimgerdemannia flammicorona]|uniref:Cas1p 10 TM acyl transferase domain-containing protein n=1 Tax=Jimgerdemannia flammicorona TaxID=994334 RepID=A0A433BFZ1_9FUNG|nr:hypothetical protein BC936DRAFT_138855 [Jimgerdemannia flammicorona]
MQEWCVLKVRQSHRCPVILGCTMVAPKLSQRLDPFHLFLAATVFVIFLAASLRYFTDAPDRNRCRSLLNDGWWIDSKFKNWQPTGCTMQTYNSDAVVKCLGNTHVLYIGDSVIRQQLFGMAEKVDANIVTKGEKHSDRVFTSSSITFEFWWDPFLNASHTIDILNGVAKFRPSLLVLGTGLWYLNYLEGSDGLAAWKSIIDRTVHQISNPTIAADIAATIVLAPVETPKYTLLNSTRRSRLSPSNIEAMNDYLFRYKDEVFIPFAWNRMVEQSPSLTDDGLHFADIIATKQADILLNFKCNDQLPKQAPMGTTCCYTYPQTRWYQNAVFLFFLAWVPLGMYFRSTDDNLSVSAKRFVNRIFPSEPVLVALFTFGLGILYMFYSDRTQIFAKAQKQFNPWEFGPMMLLALIIGLATLKHPKKDPITSDGGFLNREQTDEWKGWMQLVILIYHYWGASSISGIYNPVRILVAAYLFQSGYGHFFFFYKKGDFGVARIVSVLVRLNLLTVALEYATGNDYLSYYFTPLVSFWFLVIWVTMYVANKYNKTKWVLCLKLVVACAITTWLIHYPGVLERVFSTLEIVANVHWNAKEWRFRLALDAYIVYVGMIVAYIYIRLQDLKIGDRTNWPSIKRHSILGAIVVMVWYFWFELTRQDKFVYNAYHPFISWLPIVAFTFLRNATPNIRNTTSRFFVFFGSCSLETFIGQFHMWLAGDTKGLLVLVTPAGWATGLGWWANFVVSSAVFVWVCWGLAWSTAVICDWICGTGGKKRGAVAPAPSALTNGMTHPHSNKHAPGNSEQMIPLVSGAEFSAAVPHLHHPHEIVSDAGGNGAATAVEIVSPRSGKGEVGGDGEGEGGEEVPKEAGSFVERAWADQRVKAVVSVVGLVILNRLC